MKSNSAPRRFAISMNVITQVILVGVILVFLNIGIRYLQVKKWELTNNDYYKISEKTENLLKSLTAPVEVLVFIQPSSEDIVVNQVYQDVQMLLKEYTNVSNKIQVKYIDPDRDPINAEKLSNEFGVSVPNVVVFVQRKANDKDKRFKFIRADELVEFEGGDNPYQQSNRIKYFKGEQQFTSAIQNVIEAKQSKIYFLEGHGEGDPDSADRRKGYSSISTFIRRDNLLVERLNLLEKHVVPDDCDVLVVCNPTRGLGETEIKALKEYLGRNGRIIVMLDAMNDDSGLEPFLKEYGVKVGMDTVLLKIQDQLGGQALVSTAPGMDYASHPITESLRKDRISTLFPVARTVDRISDETKDRVTVLVKSIPDVWAESNMADLKNDVATFDDKDKAGPVPLAVAVEPSTAGEMEREGPRLVVFGSSGFVQNGQLKAGNVDLFLNSINWLLKRQQLLGIAPKSPKEFKLSLDPLQHRAVFLTVVIALPLAMGLIGVVVWWRRRR